MNISFRLITGVAVACVLSLTAQTASRQRIEYGQKIAEDIIRKEPAMPTEMVAKATRTALAKQFPQLAKDPAEPLITEMDSLRDYNAKFQKVLDEKCPVFSDAQLENLAAVKYPLYAKGDLITVYYVRGKQIESWKGRISSIEEGRVIIGSHRISFRDMEPVKGNDIELQKLIPEENRKVRDEYKELIKKKMAEKREDFRLNRQKEVEAEILAADRKLNEEHGYTLLDKTWLTPEQLVASVVKSASDTLEDERYAALDKKMSPLRAPLDAQRDVMAIRLTHEKPGLMETPATLAAEASLAKLKREELQARREKVRQETAAKKEAEAQAKAAEEKRLAEEKAKKDAEIAAKKAADEAAEAERLAEEEAAKKAVAAKEEARQREEAQAASEPIRFMEKEVGGIPMPVVVALGVVIVLGGIVSLFFVNRGRKKDEDTFAKFFEGKGKLQKDFWTKAAEDPDHFKYVAYMFPDLESATKALSHLSYMRIGPSGDLRCSRQLSFGVYPHLNGAVCFIGGTRFSYALWREASAVLPELPGAEYFKVSTEPVVMLHVPDYSQKSLNIEELGTEDTEGENGEFNRIYKYRAASRDEAMDFLDGFSIQEAGIVVHVETPDGILGKDENGVFTLENNVINTPAANQADEDEQVADGAIEQETNDDAQPAKKKTLKPPKVN